MLHPSTANRRNDLANLSFQRIVSSAVALERWFDIDVFRDTNEAERQFVNLVMHRRHIVTHNAARADEDYLAQSGDTSCRLNERIRIWSSDFRGQRALTANSLIHLTSSPLYQGEQD